MLEFGFLEQCGGFICQNECDQSGIPILLIQTRVHPRAFWCLQLDILLFAHGKISWAFRYGPSQTHHVLISSSAAEQVLADDDAVLPALD